MDTLHELDKRQLSKNAPQLRSGYNVKVHQKIKEGEKERVQIFEGLIISISSGFGLSKTFTVRKVVDGVGVEKIFPVHSPNISKIEVTRKSRVRRARLYYMTRTTGKKIKLYQEKESKETEKEAA
ncbi:50S ribosomal protein L19 [Candidatus Gracilibacteria bacterium]|nr:50S ribosomal protein L19 [Candidatus Gracilibacteria bacterium]